MSAIGYCRFLCASTFRMRCFFVCHFWKIVHKARMISQLHWSVKFSIVSTFGNWKLHRGEVFFRWRRAENKFLKIPKKSAYFRSFGATQNPLVVTPYGFDPHHRHSKIKRWIVGFSALFLFSTHFLKRLQKPLVQPREIIRHARNIIPQGMGVNSKSIHIWAMPHPRLHLTSREHLYNRYEGMPQLVQRSWWNFVSLGRAGLWFWLRYNERGCCTSPKKERPK